MSEHLYPLLAEKGMSAAELARRLDVYKSTISRWNDNGIPLSRVLDVEKETEIPREKLRPDLFRMRAS